MQVRPTILFGCFSGSLRLASRGFAFRWVQNLRSASALAFPRQADPIASSRPIDRYVEPKGTRYRDYLSQSNGIPSRELPIRKKLLHGIWDRAVAFRPRARGGLRQIPPVRVHRFWIARRRIDRGIARQAGRDRAGRGTVVARGAI